MIDSFFQTLLEISNGMGYWGVFLLMTIESSFIPFPSEVVVPPAAYLAAKGEMNVYLVVTFGILGSLVGASINYFIGRILGRPIVYSLVEKKWAKYFLLNKKKVEKAEKYFLEYGGISTFLGRLVPAVRQLISLPAGFSKMKFHSFLFFTFLGAGFWVVVLAVLGYFFGAKQDLLEEYYFEISLFFLLLAVLVVGIFIFRSKRLSFWDRLKRLFGRS